MRSGMTPLARPPKDTLPDRVDSPWGITYTATAARIARLVHRHQTCRSPGGAACRGWSRTGVSWHTHTYVFHMSELGVDVVDNGFRVARHGGAFGRQSAEFLLG